VVEIQHANPYFDDSYAVNSVNLGPYGDAINRELIPEIEKRFRGLGQGWARFTYGGSTGGWEALATQVFYPDMFNGAFAACPDPIDFRAYTVIDLYKDANAYTLKGEASSVERPAFRNYLGEVFATQRDENYMELVTGDHSRSGGQYDVWQAVFSPAGADGYPKPIFDKLSGVIDPTVAAYWKEHYDLSYIVERDWPRLPRTRAAWTTATAPSIAGTAITNWRTPIRACITIFNTFPSSSSACSRRRRPGRILRAGATEGYDAAADGGAITAGSLKNSFVRSNSWRNRK
jgi:hypothetical protein